MNNGTRLLDIDAVLAEARKLVRESGSRITPYRIGLHVGALGYHWSSVPAPYQNRHSVNSYKEGVTYALRTRRSDSDKTNGGAV